jgi:hypothetical protein
VKVYQIPRNVNDRFEIFGLKAKQLLYLLPTIIICVIIFYSFGWPKGLKIIICTALLGGHFLILTGELGNGLRASEYILLFLRYYLLDQNVYHLLSGRERKIEYKPLYYIKVNKQDREPIISEYPDFDKEEYLKRRKSEETGGIEV